MVLLEMAKPVRRHPFPKISRLIAKKEEVPTISCRYLFLIVLVLLSGSIDFGSDFLKALFCFLTIIDGHHHEEAIDKTDLGD